jgi:hypothetical protein
MDVSVEHIMVQTRARKIEDIRNMKKTHYLSKRANWQLEANKGGSLAEANTSNVIRSYLDTLYPGEYEVVSQPKWFGQPYLEMDYEQNPEDYIKPKNPTPEDVWFDTEKKVFVKNGRVIRESFVPDVGILHIKSGKRYILEVKKQQAAGNAHERACKYATPSMLEFIKKKLNVDYHPVGYVFTGGIVENKSYCREIRAFFGFANNHLLLWKEERNPIILTDWLENTVLPLLNKDDILDVRS